MTRNTPSRSHGSSGKGARKGGASGRPGQVARPRWGKPSRPEATDRDGFTARTAPLAPEERAPQRAEEPSRPERSERAARPERAARGEAREGGEGQSKGGAQRPRKQA
ncbi:hypothetical protein ACFU6L_34615, partial [Kitasatospora sp. NPDC057541]